MKKEAIKKLRAKSQSEWNEYIWNLSVNIDTDPDSNIYGDNFIQRIINLHTDILAIDKKLLDPFHSAVIYNLSTIPKSPDNALTLYSLLYLIHETRPIKHFGLLFQVLKDRELESIEYGADNLQHLLVKSMIPMDDRSNPKLKDWFHFATEIKGYNIYLLIYYFSFIGNINLALGHISRFLTAEKSFSEETYVSFKMVLIDIIPEYITIKDLLMHFVDNRITISSNPVLTLYLKEIIEEVKNNLYDTGKQYLLFLEDYFKKSEGNAQINPKFVNDICEIDNDICMAITDYYQDRSYNLQKFESPKAAAKSIVMNLDPQLN